MEEIENNVIELQINNMREKINSFSIDESISTPRLAAFGITDCYIQFYPKGSFWCTKEGHFSMIFGCPSNVDVELLLYAGNISRTPQELMNNEETNEKVYGLHDFGETSELLAEGAKDLAVGVELLRFDFKDDSLKESSKVVRITAE